MRRQAHGQMRRSQVITTWGPGALLDLPNHSVIVGGLETWPREEDLHQIVEPRLSAVLSLITGVPNPRLYEPPPDTTSPWEPKLGIGVYRFPTWFVVQEDDRDVREGSRRLVPRRALDEKGKFDHKTVVPTRFVRACPRGHVDDLDWRAFVHDPGEVCTRQLWLDERGTGGDLADLVVRCECGKSRGMHEAADLALNRLGPCQGKRPWLGRYASEQCGQPSRLLVRTATNSYFPQVVGVLSLPERRSAVEDVVLERDLGAVACDLGVGVAFLVNVP